MISFEHKSKILGKSWQIILDSQMWLLPNSIPREITDAKIHFADHYPIRSLKEFHLIFEMAKYSFVKSLYPLRHAKIRTADFKGWMNFIGVFR